jgi:hypothetical protein
MRWKPKIPATLYLIVVINPLNNFTLPTHEVSNITSELMLEENRPHSNPSKGIYNRQNQNCSLEKLHKDKLY